MKKKQKIMQVLVRAMRPLAPHEFADVIMPDGDSVTGSSDGRRYVGLSESTIGRRLREMVVSGDLTVQRRDGKNFVEYAVAVREPVAA